MKVKIPDGLDVCHNNVENMIFYDENSNKFRCLVCDKVQNFDDLHVLEKWARIWSNTIISNSGANIELLTDNSESAMVEFNMINKDLIDMEVEMLFYLDNRLLRRKMLEGVGKPSGSIEEYIHQVNKWSKDLVRSILKWIEIERIRR